MSHKLGTRKASRSVNVKRSLNAVGNPHDISQNALFVLFVVHIPDTLYSILKNKTEITSHIRTISLEIPAIVVVVVSRCYWNDFLRPYSTHTHTPTNASPIDLSCSKDRLR